MHSTAAVSSAMLACHAYTWTQRGLRGIPSPSRALPCLRGGGAALRRPGDVAVGVILELDGDHLGNRIWFVRVRSVVLRIRVRGNERGRRRQKGVERVRKE